MIFTIAFTLTNHNSVIYFQSVQQFNEIRILITMDKHLFTSSVTDGKFNFSMDGKSVLCSPPEGHWAVASGWQDEAPCFWHYGKITEFKSAEKRFIMRGKVSLPHGECLCSDVCVWRNENLLEIKRRWEYLGDGEENITLSIRFRHNENYGKLLMPAILYHGNPSGRRGTNPDGIPALDRFDGSKGFFEEHRFPAPFVSSEGANKTAAALHTIPSPLKNANRNDLWWSLGAEYIDGETELAAYSGYLHGNGRNGVAKANQRRWLEIKNCCIKLIPGAVVEKRFLLQVSAFTSAGSGFIPALDAAIKIHSPHSLPVDIKEVMQRKYSYALSRSYRNGKVAGALFNSARNGEQEIVFGWCGRSEVMGYAPTVLGEIYGDDDALKRADECFDFLVSSPINENGFFVAYDIPSGQWRNQDFVSQGQTLEVFALSLQDRKKRGLTLKQSWLDFLCRTCDTLAARVEKSDWRPVSTNEAFLAAPLAAAAELLGEKRFAGAALKIADHYIARHIDMTEPYWGGTLDACCEDKEGAAAAMSAFFTAWELSGETKYLSAAEHATAVYLTYYQLWTIAMPPGLLADNGFDSCGWTAVSVQNMHLDVYGVWVTPLLLKIADALGRENWKALAIPMFVNCGQLLDFEGSQGEQIQQTNFGQRKPCDNVELLRGHYVEAWEVFWITAAFLYTASQLEQMGYMDFANGND